MQIDEVAAGSPACFTASTSDVAICGEDPEPLNAPTLIAQRNCIAGYVQAAEDALFSSGFADPLTGDAADLDVDSVIEHYLASELVKNAQLNPP